MNWPYFITYLALRVVAGASLIVTGWALADGNVFGALTGIGVAALSWLMWKWFEER